MSARNFRRSAAPREPGGVSVLYEDNHLLVLNKPAGLATIGVTADRDSLVRRAKAYIKQRHDKPGNVYLGVMSRLDAVVSGVIVLARTSKAANRLTQQFFGREVQKTYRAIVAGSVNPAEGTLVHLVRKNEADRRMEIVSGRGQEARLRYRQIAGIDGLALLEIDLETGRKHQIRVQLAARGWPVVGDGKYGSRLTWRQGIALHALRLGLVHPVGGQSLQFAAAPPDCWPRWAVVG